MADEMTTNTGTALETGTAPPEGGQVQPPAPTPEATPAPVPQQQTVIDVEKELQRIRSQSGREIAEAARRAQAAEQRAAEIERQFQEMRIRSAEDPDRERLAVERDQAMRYAQDAQKRLEEQELIRVRWERINATAQRTGVPFDVLSQAESPEDMAAIVAQHYQSQTEAQAKAQADKIVRRSEANAVDLGGGNPSTPITRKEEKFREAWKRKDARSYVLEILNED